MESGKRIVADGHEGGVPDACMDMHHPGRADREDYSESERSTYSFESFHLGEVLEGLKLCLVQLNCLQVFELLEEGCVLWGDFLDFCRVQRQLCD